MTLTGESYGACVAELARLVERARPVAPMTVSDVYATASGGSGPWWRCTVRVGVSVQSPRFTAFDDASSFRLAALAMQQSLTAGPTEGNAHDA